MHLLKIIATHEKKKSGQFIQTNPHMWTFIGVKQCIYISKNEKKKNALKRFRTLNLERLRMFMFQVLHFCVLSLVHSWTLSYSSALMIWNVALTVLGWTASLFTYPIPDKHCFEGIFIGARATSHSLNTRHATWSNLIEIKGLELHAHIQSN